MIKQREDYVTGADGDERHPAFGVITLHRVSSAPGAVLFQSDTRHAEYMRVTVHEATRKRDLKHDWVHPERVICEVSMSMAQFASFVSGAGQGGGVPCTIERATTGSHEPGDRPGLVMQSRLALTAAEVQAAAHEAYRKIQTAEAAYEAALNGKAPAAERRKLLADLRSAIGNAAPNVDYAARRLAEHAEDVVEKSRADIEALVAAAQGRRPVLRVHRAADEGTEITGEAGEVTAAQDNG